MISESVHSTRVSRELFCLQQQQNLAKKNFNKINVTTDLSKIEAADQIIDACSADESALLTHTAKAVPNATIISLNSEKSPMHSNHVSVKMYSPIRETKTAKVTRHNSYRWLIQLEFQMFANSKASKAAVEEVNQLLASIGFTVLSEEDSLVADRLVLDMQQVGKSSQLSKLASILVNPLSTPVAPVAPKEQYLLF